MSRAAFVKAERTRRRQRPPTPGQRHMLRRLSEEAGIEPPIVHWYGEARDAIRRLRHYLALCLPCAKAWKRRWEEELSA